MTDARAGGLRVRTALTALLVSLALAAGTVLGVVVPVAPASAAVSCATADARLVPACGVWWGIWPRTDAAGVMTGNLPANLASLEQAVGRRFDLVSRYKGWGQDVYDAWDVGLRDSGHLVLEDLTARDFATNTYVRWADIAAGRHDAYLTRQAVRAKAFGAKTFFSFNQEPEQALERGNAAGTPAEFAAAYRHVRAVFDAAGARNVVWVWWVMGYAGHNPVYPALWPGADVVDWIGYDPYDFNTCHATAAKTAAQAITPWYRWIDAQPWAAGKPLMLSEFGSNGPDQQAWLASVPSVLRGLPRVKAAVQFDSRPGGCDHRVTASAANLAGYTAASRDGYVNPSGATCDTRDGALAPACGVLWGIWPRTDAAGTMTTTLAANTTSLEAATGSRFDLVLRYKGWGETLVDTADVALRDTGHTVVEDLSSRSFATNTWTSWRAIAAGTHDAYLVAQAKRVAAFGAPVLLSFSGEAENALDVKAADLAGGWAPSDYAAAYRHVRAVFDANGARNARWVWWVRGADAYKTTYPAMWPGAASVDWVAWSAFDRSTCAAPAVAAQTPAQTLTPFYTWLAAQPWASGKPLMLAAFGTHAPSGADRSAWYAQVPAALAAMPRVKAAISFDSRPGACDFRWAQGAANRTAFAAATRAVLAPRR